MLSCSCGEFDFCGVRVFGVDNVSKSAALCGALWRGMMIMCYVGHVFFHLSVQPASPNHSRRQFSSPRQLRVGSMAGQLTDDEIARLWHINDVECAIRIRMACGIQPQRQHPQEPEDGHRTTTTATTTVTATATSTPTNNKKLKDEEKTTWY